MQKGERLQRLHNIVQLMTMHVFGSKAEQIRQWGLLGHLLRRMSLSDSLSFMERAFGWRPVAWPMINLDVAAGATLSEALVAVMGPEALDEIVASVKNGETNGSLPDTLERLVEEDVVVDTRAVDTEVVRLVYKILFDAVQQSVDRVAIDAPSGERMLVRFRIRGNWEPYLDIPTHDGNAVIRRLLFMCGVPYWTRGAASGTAKPMLAFLDMICVTRQQDGSILVEFLGDTYRPGSDT